MGWDGRLEYELDKILPMSPKLTLLSCWEHSWVKQSVPGLHMLPVKHTG